MQEPRVIYEGPHLIAVEKPAGLVVHAAKVAAGRTLDPVRAAEPTLVDWLLKKYPEMRTVGDDPATRPGIVHRLDKETSGIMLVARDQATFERLKALFADRGMEKKYLALVKGVPKHEAGTIDAPIGIRNGTLKRSIRSSQMAKPAVTEYRTLRTFEESSNGEKFPYALLEVAPRTGRTHQIRVHLASIGHPVLGDHLYGPKKQPAFVHRLMLHARSIAFTDEHGVRFELEAPAPPEFRTE